jgi:hypothetical protein
VAVRLRPACGRDARGPTNTRSAVGHFTPQPTPWPWSRARPADRGLPVIVDTPQCQSPSNRPDRVHCGSLTDTPVGQERTPAFGVRIASARWCQRTDARQLRRPLTDTHAGALRDCDRGGPYAILLSVFTGDEIGQRGWDGFAVLGLGSVSTAGGPSYMTAPLFARPPGTYIAAPRRVPCRPGLHRGLQSSRQCKEPAAT